MFTSLELVCVAIPMFQATMFISLELANWSSTNSGYSKSLWYKLML